ncbi:Uncharacterised protein [uncultured archaeon]|nr:Uncharacterised protein [uncultured archaeon]
MKHEQMKSELGRFKITVARQIPVNGQKAAEPYVDGAGGAKKFFSHFKDGDEMVGVEANGGSILCGVKGETLYVLVSRRDLLHTSGRAKKHQHKDGAGPAHEEIVKGG